MVRLRATLADYMVIAISPALIMALVGSLVFFLIELFYQGQYQARMQYVFALFVFASVLIGRISIEEGRERALGFSVVLAAAVLLVLNKFVDYSGFFDRLSLVINVALIVVILWCSNKLTWDCTVIDEQEDASGEGLLQTMGMDEEAAQPMGLDLEATSGSEPAQPKPEPKGLWQRFVEARKKKHAPGVWVVYFSMAALPIFGIGQGFIFGQDLEGRRWVFKLLVVYVGAALGLLVTTSFLGLRRYLRQRRLEMPPQMAGAWLGVGAAMIVALLLLCILLPRRNAEYSVTHIPAFAKAPDNVKTNKWGWGNDGPEEDVAKRQVKRDDAKQQSDQTGEKQEDGKSGKDGQQAGGKEKSDQPGTDKKQSEQGTGGEKSQDKKNNQSGDNQQDKKSGKQGEQSGAKQQDEKNGKQGEQSGEKKQDKSGEQSGQKQQDKSNDKQGEQQQQQPKEKKDASSEQQKSDSEQKRDDESTEKKTAENKSQSKSKSKFDPAKLLQQIGGGIGMLLKLLYWLLAILIVAWFVWRYWEQVRDAIRNFIQAVREFWARLFGGTVEPAAEIAPEAIDTGPPPRPFSDFPNPFQTDLHQRLSMKQLVAYSFEAFEAWAHERGYGRHPQQTPHEFASLVGQAAAPLSQAALRLAELYNRSAYSDGSLPASSLDHVRQFWAQLTATQR